MYTKSATSKTYYGGLLVNNKIELYENKVLIILVAYSKVANYIAIPTLFIINFNYTKFN